MPGSSAQRDTFRETLKYWLGIVVQLTVPVGAFAAAMIATRYEARTSAREILNQREQADSQLRATMFGTLVSPIVGPEKDGQQPIDPVRYALLVELLALNFNDHFEFGPLMASADGAIVASGRTLGAEVVDKTRWELRSVAHRIADRQIATLWEDKTWRNCKGAGAWEATVYLFSAGYADDAFNAFTSIKRPGVDTETFYYRMNANQSPLRLTSPDCQDVLTVTFGNPDWPSETLEVQATRSVGASNYPTDQFTFRVNPFTFPFSDNTLFSDGNRFAVFMKDLTTETHDGAQMRLVTLRVRWFPKAFYPPTERPANLADVRKQLDMGSPGT